MKKSYFIYLSETDDAKVENIKKKVLKTTNEELNSYLYPERSSTELIEKLGDYFSSKEHETDFHKHKPYEQDERALRQCKVFLLLGDIPDDLYENKDFAAIVHNARQHGYMFNVLNTRENAAIEEKLTLSILCQTTGGVYYDEVKDNIRMLKIACDGCETRHKNKGAVKDALKSFLDIKCKDAGEKCSVKDIVKELYPKIANILSGSSRRYFVYNIHGVQSDEDGSASDQQASAQSQTVQETENEVFSERVSVSNLAINAAIRASYSNVVTGVREMRRPASESSFIPILTDSFEGSAICYALDMSVDQPSTVQAILRRGSTLEEQTRIRRNPSTVSSQSNASINSDESGYDSNFYDSGYVYGEEGNQSYFRPARQPSESIDLYPMRSISSGIGSTRFSSSGSVTGDARLHTQISGYSTQSSVFGEEADHGRLEPMESVDFSRENGPSESNDEPMESHAVSPENDPSESNDPIEHMEE